MKADRMVVYDQADETANNLDPFYKRSTGIAMGFVSTNSGGILSTYVLALCP